MNKKTIPIKGMHCRSCELLIEEKLKEIPGIKSCHVDYKKKQAVAYSKTEIDDNIIIRAVEDAGYGVGVDDSNSWISKNPSDYLDLALAFLLLAVLFFVGKKTGLANIASSSAGNPSNLLVVILIGLTAGISTCMALVGGLVLGISARFAEKHPEATSIQKFRPHLYFNLGRILSYFVLGGLIGQVGSVFQMSGLTLGLLIIAVGLVMLVLGLQLTEIFPRLSNGGLTLPAGLSRLLGIKNNESKEYSHANSIITGALTFFLPCGFTQAMQLYAISSGSFISGALIMSAFALGTAPGLLGIGGLTSILKGAIAKKFFKFTGLLVVFLSIYNISNGYNLTCWRLSLGGDKAEEAVASDPNVKLIDGVQYVYMDQVGGGYRPNKFTIQEDIPVKWIINAKNTDSCSASILSSKLGIRKVLEPGENIIEFTPTEAGEVKFSCLMGMYTGKFNVIKASPPLSSISGGETQSDEEKKPKETQSAPTEVVAPEQPEVITPKKTEPVSKPTPKPAPVKEAPNPEVQVIKTTFNEVDWNSTTDITPSDFTVTVGKPVRFEVYSTADGVGCMSTITVPGLIEEVDLLEKGKTLVYEFTPSERGTYDITCAMGVPRGKIIVT